MTTYFKIIIIIFLLFLVALFIYKATRNTEGWGEENPTDSEIIANIRSKYKKGNKQCMDINGTIIKCGYEHAWCENEKNNYYDGLCQISDEYNKNDYPEGLICGKSSTLNKYVCCNKLAVGVKEPIFSNDVCP